MNIKLVIRMGLAVLWYVDISAALDQQKGVERSVKGLGGSRQLKLKKSKTKAPTTATPSSSPSDSPSELPSQSPTTPLEFVKYVSEILPLEDEAHPPIGQWYDFDMRPLGEATFVRLQDEVCNLNPAKVHPDLVVYAPNCITSALRLYTTPSNVDKAEVGINFYDGPVGLFNGMKFKDMVTGGVTFEYDFFKANVIGGNLNAAPAIKIGLISPAMGLGSYTSLVWEPYRGGCGASCTNTILVDMWHAISVGVTTGSSNIASGSPGWWRVGYQSYGGSLAAWAAWFEADASYGSGFMDDAVIVSVRIGVGSGNPGVKSYVDSLRIRANGYDWTWIFETQDQCNRIETQTFI